MGGDAQEVAGHVLDGGEVGRRVFLSGPAFVVAEDQVHDLVQSVFDAPILPYGLGDGAVQHQQVEQFGDRCPLAGAIKRAPQRLAADGEHTRAGLMNHLDPGDETALEPLGIQGRKEVSNPAKYFMATLLHAFGGWTIQTPCLKLGE